MFVSLILDKRHQYWPHLLVRLDVLSFILHRKSTLYFNIRVTTFQGLQLLVNHHLKIPWFVLLFELVDIPHN